MKLPAGFPAARNSKSMVHAGTGRWRQKNGRPMLIVGSRPAVYRMAVVTMSHSKSTNRWMHVGHFTRNIWGPPMVSIGSMPFPSIYK